jgi:hypothetical protein
LRKPMATAWARVLAPSLASNRPTYVLTVAWLTSRRLAISRFG